MGTLFPPEAADYLRATAKNCKKDAVKFFKRVERVQKNKSSGFSKRRDIACINELRKKKISELSSLLSFAA